MKRMIKLTLVLAMVSTLAIAAPTPTPSVVSWELDCFVPDVIKPIQMTIGDSDEATTFWYLRMLVSNTTGDDVDFIPNVDLVTNTGEIHPESVDVPVSVFTAIKGLYNQPMLMDLTTATGKTLQGDDNAKEIVAMFSDVDADAGQVDIYIEGLSGETVTVALPSPITRTYIGANDEEIIETITSITLRKTLRLTYQLAGDVDARLVDDATLIAREWVMR